MGNTTSSSDIHTSQEPGGNYNRNNDNNNNNNRNSSRHNSNNDDDDAADADGSKYRSFPGSAILEKTFCGSIDTTDPSEYDNVSTMNRLLKRAEILCVSSPVSSDDTNNKKKTNLRDDYDEDTEENSIVSRKTKKTTSSGKLLARALVSEVTDNPKTMTQAAMQERERKLLKAAAAAAQINSPEKKRKQAMQQHNRSQYHPFSPLVPPIQQQLRKPIGVAAPPHVLRSVAYACTGDDDTVTDLCNAPQQEFYNASTAIDGATNTGNNTVADDMDDIWADHPNVVTIGVALSRQAQIYNDNDDNHNNNSNPPVQGHRGTVSRQTQYDFNELQDRQFKYVSSVGPAGWRAGGAESGEGKLPDETHIPIIRIHCPTEASVDAVITALASGEIFIPHIQIMPELLTVHNCLSTGSTNLVVQFGCERNDELPVDEWPNWCLEFLHNQLYEYFQPTNGVSGGGAVWMKRSFSTTLAKQVRWKTVKHMNRYFAAAEKVIASWRDMGPQVLTPTPSHLEGGASVDEVARPHGIYLYRGGVPTNYFCPNFEPPYTTKMTKSLLMTVLQKSWDTKRREWSSKPVPRLVEPSALCAAACGITSDLSASGYMAHEATTVIHAPTSVTSVKKPQSYFSPQPQSRSNSPFSTKEPLSIVEFGRTFSEEVNTKENNAKLGNTEVVTKKSVPHKHMNHNSPKVPTKANSTKSQEKRVLSSMDDTENNTSVAPSLFNASVAESGTTVLHTNSSKAPNQTKPVTPKYSKNLFPSPKNDHHSVKENSTGERRLYSDEDFLDDLSSVDTPPALLAVTSPRGAAIAAEEKLQRQIKPHLSHAVVGNTQLSLVKNVSESPTSSPTKRAQMKLDREKRVAKQEQNSQMSYAIPANNRNNYKISSVEPTPSLEYSTDGSSAFFHELTSVPTVQPPPAAQLLQPLQSSHSANGDDNDDDESALLSLQESSSSYVSEVPTDEALFSVGWAKALDPNSGNYYYFTLDRTRTVWENPLSSSQWGSELPPPVHQSGNNLMGVASTYRPIDP